MKINQRLFDHYGIDTNKNLGIDTRCPRPFDTVLIDKQGSCFACECQSWLPQSIGNLRLQPLENIIQSATRQHLIDSIDDGTYRYCNEKQCTYLLNTVDRFHKTHKDAHIKHLRLGIDDSCNLKCPSCRNNLVFHKSGNTFDVRIELANKINHWLSKYKRDIWIHVGSDGDPFASHVYRHFLQNTPHKQNISYSLLTNGLMFKDFVHKIPHVMNGLVRLGVSIDGASRHTYEKLRLGGRWDKVLEGIYAITEAKKQHNFTLHWHMVVQEDNWREIPLMLELAHKHDVDELHLNKIQDWQTNLDVSSQNFYKQNEFKRLLDEVNRDPITRSTSLS